MDTNQMARNIMWIKPPRRSVQRPPMVSQASSVRAQPIRIQNQWKSEFGYGRPPKASQFKPGQSGNPGGRPKGKPDVRREIEDVLSELVLVNFGGEERRISLVAAVMLKQCEKALEGNHRSAESILKKATEFGFLNEPSKWDEYCETLLCESEEE